MKDQDVIKRIKEEDILKPEEIDRDEYPCLQNLSSAFFYKYLPIPQQTDNPEFVYINRLKKSTEPYNEIRGAISTWNMAWESGHLRYKMLEHEIPESLKWLSEYSEKNIYLIPYKKENNYYAFQHLLNLIPYKTRIQNDLPLFKKGLWPSEMDKWYMDRILPLDFDEKLSKAFAFHIWPLLNNSSRINAFDNSDPIKLLAHNLNFWVPYLNMIIEDELRNFSRLEPENENEINELKELNKEFPENIKLMKPRKGGFIWYGEDEAWQFSKKLVEKADSQGKLREIMDLVRSNRIQDDFSDIWSYEKEDFERKIYKKRNKYKVSFVEIDNAIPIQGPNSEIINELVWEDFFTLLNKKEKQIVICIKNGYSNLTEISKKLGYANHSPISKSLKLVREKLENYIE